MNFYLVWVSSPQYKSLKPLTYSFNGLLKLGSIVKLPFKNMTVIGLVDSKTSEPNFITKDIECLLVKEALPSSILKIFTWLKDYYPAPPSSHLQLLLPSNILSLTNSKPQLDENVKSRKVKLPPLTVEQIKVINEINQCKNNSILLHGETGSGKTRVYIELIEKVIIKKQSVIVLTPEIGMTPQLIKSLEESFPGKVVLIHSSLTDKTRRNNWLNIIQNNDPQIIVGPRSALFAPINNLGLIIVDEAHDSSYKQEQLPYYQASRVAAKLSEINNIKVIFGTATPLISDYYVFKNKGLLISRMELPAVPLSKEVNSLSIETVTLTDKSNFTRSNWLSNKLLDSITESLRNNEQSIVFLNRRGTAQIILCQICGWQSLCPNCDNSLTYHADDHKMICHSCNFKQDIPSNCPICKSPDIIFRGVGTKAITEELNRLFGNANIKRFDKDNSKADSLERNYKDLLSGKINIAVGTQIITKGLDLPKLSTLGVVVADSGLFFPDFMAEERTFQNIMQVIGRVGRGHISGRVIVQTYSPSSTSIVYALKKDYLNFYNQQIKERQKYKFPPFVFILKISARRASQKSSQLACSNLIKKLISIDQNIEISGPAPSFHEKMNGKFEWQIILKAKNRKSLVEIINTLPSGFSYDIDPANLL